MKTKGKRKKRFLTRHTNFLQQKNTFYNDFDIKNKVAKGTFYLYFTNKYDIKNKLVVHKTQELFDAAERA